MTVAACQKAIGPAADPLLLRRRGRGEKERKRYVGSGGGTCAGSHSSQLGIVALAASRRVCEDAMVT